MVWYKAYMQKDRTPTHMCNVVLAQNDFLNRRNFKKNTLENSLYCDPLNEKKIKKKLKSMCVVLNIFLQA